MFSSGSAPAAPCPSPAQDPQTWSQDLIFRLIFPTIFPRHTDPNVVPSGLKKNCGKFKVPPVGIVTELVSLCHQTVTVSPLVWQHSWWGQLCPRAPQLPLHSSQTILGAGGSFQVQWGGSFSHSWRKPRSWGTISSHPALPPCPFLGNFSSIAQELFGTPGISESSWRP